MTTICRLVLVFVVAGAVGCGRGAPQTAPLGPQSPIPNIDLPVAYGHTSPL